MTRRRTEARDPFEALADHTRRDILDLLRRDGVLTAGEIAAAFAEISRPAVSRHLRVLRDAGFVKADVAGREWRYQLNAAALARLQREWFARFAPLWEQSLAQLKDELEGSAERTRKRGA